MLSQASLSDNELAPHLAISALIQSGYLFKNALNTPLNLAIFNNHINMALFLIEKNNLKEDDYATCLELASETGCIEVVKALLKKTSKRHHTRALFAAIKHKHSDIVEMLINATYRNSNGLEETRLTIAAKNGDLASVHFLLQHGAKIDQMVNCGRQLTALYFAIKYHHQDVTRLLLQQGANINIRDHHSETFLHHLYLTPRNVTHFLEYGADINAKNNAGETPLHITLINYNRNRKAVDNHKISKFLEYGPYIGKKSLHIASPEIKNRLYMMPAVTKKPFKATPDYLRKFAKHYDVRNHTEITSRMEVYLWSKEPNETETIDVTLKDLAFIKDRNGKYTNKSLKDKVNLAIKAFRNFHNNRFLSWFRSSEESLSCYYALRDNINNENVCLKIIDTFIKNNPNRTFAKTLSYYFVNDLENMQKTQSFKRENMKDHYHLPGSSI